MKTYEVSYSNAVLITTFKDMAGHKNREKIWFVILECAVKEE